MLTTAELHELNMKGLTVSEIARRHKLKYHNLYSRLKHYRKKNKLKGPERKGRSGGPRKRWNWHAQQDRAAEAQRKRLKEFLVETRDDGTKVYKPGYPMGYSPSLKWHSNFKRATE